MCFLAHFERKPLKRIKNGYKLAKLNLPNPNSQSMNRLRILSKTPNYKLPDLQKLTDLYLNDPSALFKKNLYLTSA